MCMTNAIGAWTGRTRMESNVLRKPCLFKTWRPAGWMWARTGEFLPLLPMWHCRWKFRYTSLTSPLFPSTGKMHIHRSTPSDKARCLRRSKRPTRPHLQIVSIGVYPGCLTRGTSFSTHASFQDLDKCHIIFFFLFFFFIIFLFSNPTHNLSVYCLLSLFSFLLAM